MSPERVATVQELVQNMLKARFIREIMYPTWLSNVMMVKKSNKKWHMCIDYTDLNKACPKDSYPLPSIDGLVDVAFGFRFLSFMDAYLGYNQIPMHPCDAEKTTFTPMDNYYYTIMPFGLKNKGVIFQRLMDKVFTKYIRNLMEIYIDDMLVKTTTEESLISDLEKVFKHLWHHNMRLNPPKMHLRRASW